MSWQTLGMCLLTFTLTASVLRADERPVVLTIVGPRDDTLALTADEFRALPHVTLETVDRKGQSVKYRGVPLHELLKRVKVPQAENLRAEWLQRTVRCEATDGYRVVFALPELDPAFSDRTVLVADEENGQPLDADKGPFQVIVPGEKRHARWIRLLREIRVLEVSRD